MTSAIRVAKIFFALSCALFGLAGMPSNAHAQVTLGASYRSSGQAMGLTATSTTAYSFSLQIGLGAYVRIGLTNERSLSTEKGYKAVCQTNCDPQAISADNPSASVLETYKQTTSAVANSLDLTLVLYGGDVFVPYILGGAVMKTYKIVESYGTISNESAPQTIYGPNCGLGLNIQLHRDLSLNLRYTVSDTGIKTDPITGLSSRVLEPSSSFGIEYKI